MKRLLALLVLLAAIPLAYGALTCSIEANSTCSSGTKYFGLENDTGGSTNAHAQNQTLDTYANSVCCSSDTTGTLGYACTGDVIASLSNETNAHVQGPNQTGYSVDVCMSHSNTDITCSAVNGSCTGSQECVMSISDYDNAHAGACGDYDISICCEELNAPPPTPTLLEPADGNTSVFERYTHFNWTTETDPNGDPVTYQINISAPAGCASIPVRNTSVSNYTSIEELCTDNTYNWTVRACDDKDACSSYASAFNFSIASVVSISLTTNNTNFGSLNASSATNNVTDDTLDGSPGPLVVLNDGNVRINTSVNATDPLWSNAGLGTLYFQFADENSSSWTDMSTTGQAHTSDLLYDNSRELEIRIQVPVQEPPGTKQSTVYVTGVSNE